MASDATKMNKSDFNDLRDGIEVMKIAAQCTLPLIQVMTLCVIKKKFAVILRHGHSIPDPHQAVILKQSCVELSEDKRDQLWSESALPMLLQGDAEWSLDNPHWWALKGLYCETRTNN